MAIVRTARPERNFYILDKRISEDKRLSWGARGLLVFLLGKPDHWKVSIQALVNETEGAAKRAGKSVVYGYLAELLEVGYVTRQKYGSGEIDYFVHEMPSPVEPNSEIPVLDKPVLDKPDLENQPLVSTDLKQGLTHSEDSFGTGGVAAATPAGDGKKKSAKAKNVVPSTAAWDAFSAAYKKRYGVEPLRNARVNVALKKVVESVGGDKAPLLAAHYLTMGGFYVQCQHDATILVRDIQIVWNNMHKASAAGAQRKPTTMADYDAIDYSKGVKADGSF
ncbi:hypothetical protein [Burkholderia sp. Se-20378]|uniref:hypothetical protein n=1 Tax=Burkholderia sp. Se-20378 TaxID=2703899 RepID=UPI00197DD346|nr:hypothetical protein [Burkholderia sp. Se-20378]MBN3770723.1 hypothetical protein [Burkholderia sp. Se-20378]